MALYEHINFQVYHVNNIAVNFIFHYFKICNFLFSFFLIYRFTQFYLFIYIFKKVYKLKTTKCDPPTFSSLIIIYFQPTATNDKSYIFSTFVYEKPQQFSKYLVLWRKKISSKHKIIKLFRLINYRKIILIIV